MDPPPNGYKHLSSKMRNKVISHLLGSMENGVLPRGKLLELSLIYGVHRATISRLWARATISRATLLANSPELISRRFGQEHNLKYPSEELRPAMLEIPFNSRPTQRAFAHELGVSQSVVKKALFDGLIRPHTNNVKPPLTEHNRLQRVEYALSKRNKDDTTQFADMMDVVHVDEKWFNCTERIQRGYLVEGEEPPERVAGLHIGKVMFLCAVARPRPGFNGKIGMWPIGEWVAARRNSRNRPAGTLEWKNVPVTKEIYKGLMIDEVLPAIMEKWPGSERVVIQQDGAKPHGITDDPEWLEAVEETQFPFVLETQPPNSPDLNILDIGFFRVIQSLNAKNHKNTSALITAVDIAFNNYGEDGQDGLANCFLTLMTTCNQIIDHQGGNHFPIVRMRKSVLRRAGNLPDVIPVTAEAAQYGDE
jgi:hypothetical protein